MVAAGALSRISPDGVWRFSVKKYCETSRLLALSGRCQNEYSCQKRFVNFPMVTGGKGISVIAPLTPTAEWPSMKDFAHRFATAQAQAEPDRLRLRLRRPDVQKSSSSTIYAISAALPRLCPIELVQGGSNRLHCRFDRKSFVISTAQHVGISAMQPKW